MTNLRVEDLALKIQEMLGENYRVSVNCDVNPSANEVQVVLFTTRKPYKIEGINSEVMEIYIELYMPVLIQEKKEQILAQINSKLNGYRKGKIISSGEEYKFFSFLDFIRPLQAPVVDTGTMMQLIALTGSVLITGSNGALAGNEVETSFIFNPDNAETRLEGKVEVLSSSFALVKEAESPQMASSNIAKAFNKTQVYSYSFTLLLLKNKIGERILKGVRNIQPFELNERVDIKEIYPPFTGVDNLEIENQCVITGCQLDRNAGAFSTVNITFQDKLEL